MEKYNEEAIENENSLENISGEELVELKKQAIADEDYDKAKEIKQEQERRKIESFDEEKQVEKEEKNKKIESLKNLLQEHDNVEKSNGNIDISDEELVCVEDLMRRMDKINSQYDYPTNFLEKLIWFKSLDHEDKYKYYKDNEIETKVDFQKHVLNLCREYLKAHFEYLESNWIRVDLDDIIDAIRSLDEYSDFLDLNSSDCDSELYDLHSRVNGTLNDMKNRIYEYLETI